jgi:hypothetical protein
MIGIQMGDEEPITRFEFLDIWEAQVYMDERGPATIVGYSSTQTGALLLGKGKGWYGADGHAGKRRAVRLGYQVYLIEGPIDLDGLLAKRREEVKQQALSKLSPEEKEALELK